MKPDAKRRPIDGRPLLRIWQNRAFFTVLVRLIYEIRSLCVASVAMLELARI
jgi:hypothetical protein